MKTMRVSSLYSFLFFTALFLFLKESSFADFPPVLVTTSGTLTVYPGVQVSGSNGIYCKYVMSDGVLILTGTNGGSTAWGATESAALTTPSGTGAWNGSTSANVPGRTFKTPQVLVYYAGVGTPVALQGLDGAQHQPQGTGTVNGKFAVAYGVDGTLGDGYIFRFGNDDSLPVYRYQSGSSGLLSLDASNGWPPSNVYVFPAQVLVHGNTLSLSNFTEGFNNGYWGKASYAGTTSGGADTSGQLNIFITPDGTSGEIYGALDGDDGVFIEWDSSLQAFPSEPVSSVPQGTPAYGPPQMEWTGGLLPFQYSDVNGSDVYGDDSGRVATIDSGDNVTVTDSYTTWTGSYDPNAQVFNSNDGSQPDIAAVSADGMTILSPAILTVYTTGWVPPPMYFLSSSMAAAYSLYRPDGKAAFAFIAPAGWTSMMFAFDAPDVGANWNGAADQYDYYPRIYSTSSRSVIDATNGWPAPDVTMPNIPVGLNLWVNGSNFNGSSVGSFQSDGNFFFLMQWSLQGANGSLYCDSLSSGQTSAFGTVDGHDFNVSDLTPLLTGGVAGHISPSITRSEPARSRSAGAEQCSAPQ